MKRELQYTFHGIIISRAPTSTTFTFFLVENYPNINIQTQKYTQTRPHTRRKKTMRLSILLSIFLLSVVKRKRINAQ